MNLPCKNAQKQQADQHQQDIVAFLLSEQFVQRLVAAAGGIVRQMAMQQARQLRQQSRVVRRFLAQRLEQAAPAYLLVHPAFQPRFGGFPQIQFGIELQTQPLDIEQCLLQQYQLRLNFNAEAARDLEQAQQHAAE